MRHPMDCDSSAQLSPSSLQTMAGADRREHGSANAPQRNSCDPFLFVRPVLAERLGEPSQTMRDTEVEFRCERPFRNRDRAESGASDRLRIGFSHRSLDPCSSANPAILRFAGKKCETRQNFIYLYIVWFLVPLLKTFGSIITLTSAGLPEARARSSAGRICADSVTCSPCPPMATAMRS